MDVKQKIVYIHPSIRVYRKEIFRMLSKKFNIDFFWSEDMSKDSGHIFEEVNLILKDLDISFVQSKEIHKLPIDNFSFDLFKLLFLNYKIFIFSNITSVPFLLLSPILKFLGKKIIIFDELWRYPAEVKKYRFIYPYVMFLSKYCIDGVVAAGSKAKEFYINEFNYDKDKIEIAYNTTVDNKLLIQDEKLNLEIKEKMNNVTKNKKILYLGRIVEYKGLDILIKSMKYINTDYDLIVIGDGDFLDYCKVLADSLGLSKRIHFLGLCFSRESAYYYKNSDIFVLPTKFSFNSNVQIESWGFTINEAMSLEIPVVSTTAVGSAYDLIIDGKTGCIADAGSISSLVSKINFIINNNQNNIIGRSGRKHLIKMCSYENNFVSYKKIINRILNE